MYNKHNNKGEHYRINDYMLLIYLLLGSAQVSCQNGEIEFDTATDTGVEIIEIDAEIKGVISNITVRQHERVRTMLIVAWYQESKSDGARVKYTFENDEWYESPTVVRDVGNQEEIVLGVPENSKVTMQIVAKTGDKEQETEAFTVPNGPAPAPMPRPTIESFDASIASPNRWLFGSVESTIASDRYYYGHFWLYIIDRKGRIVWYYSDLGDDPVLGFPRISRDNRYIFFPNRTPWTGSGFTPSVVKMTLDWKYHEKIPLPLSDNVDMTDDGSILFNTNDGGYARSSLKEYIPGKKTRVVWDCGSVFGDDCYSNTVNWSPIDDTVLMSFPYLKTVVEIERKSGQIKARYGSASGSYAFDPKELGFEFQHYANITPEGTLMVSSHMPGSDEVHAFMEFDIDRKNKVLSEKWIYNQGDEWAKYMGEAHKIPNGKGNVLANYGTGGVIKEITPDKEIAWYVKWDADFSNDKYNNMVGHCTLLDDLYALCNGPE